MACGVAVFPCECDVCIRSGRTGSFREGLRWSRRAHIIFARHFYVQGHFFLGGVVLSKAPGDQRHSPWRCWDQVEGCLRVRWAPCPRWKYTSLDDTFHIFQCKLKQQRKPDLCLSHAGHATPRPIVGRSLAWISSGMLEGDFCTGMSYCECQIVVHTSGKPVIDFMTLQESTTNHSPSQTRASLAPLDTTSSRSWPNRSHR